ncbi:hypothetical protein, partial [Actinoplanes philippinensis]|uniref:hypothetical protein n=1 Tax=Actinoplanes philippinensis TaxID=35752 RepID=UPI0033DACFBE
MDVRELWRKVYVPAVGTFAGGVLLDVVGLTDVWSIPHADAPESWHLASLAAVTCGSTRATGHHESQDSEERTFGRSSVC